MFKLSTHSGRLERWLGKENVEHVSKCMSGYVPEGRWYGTPIAVAGVPGRVYVGADGDFRGRISNGYEASALDVAESLYRRLRQGFRVAAQQQLATANSGFSSLGALIQAATANGQRRMYSFVKTGVTGSAVQQTSSLWAGTGQPAVGGAASAAPGGRATTSSTTGAIPFANPSSGTQHLVSAFPLATGVGGSLLLYDRIFDVAKTMSSSVTEAVTGVPTRYQNTTAGTIDSAENNFLFMETQTTIAGVAHNWTTCKYTNQAGATGAVLPSVSGISACVAMRCDMPTATWFAPLASGDSGIGALTQMQCSVATVTGAINFGIGHPIAWWPCPVANQICVYDGTSTAFNFERIFDNACLTWLEPIRLATNQTSYSGTFSTVFN